MMCKIIADINDYVVVKENPRHYEEGWCVTIQMDNGDEVNIFFCAEHKQEFKEIIK